MTGLDYYGARYYDPVAGTFTTADNLLLDAKAVQQGQARLLLNRYAYVEGNPESRTDPSGHRLCDTKDGTCGQNHGDPCRGQVQQCEAIYAAFSDHAIQRYLLLLARTEIGAMFLTFILFMADKVGGDRFIQWGHLGNSGPPNPAVSDAEGYITLNLDFIPGSSRIPDQTFASAIMHETVEVYYDVVLGIRDMAKLHADYVADFFAGML